MAVGAATGLWMAVEAVFLIAFFTFSFSAKKRLLSASSLPTLSKRPSTTTGAWIINKKKKKKTNTRLARM
jgi:hypothetical protein